jgi:serine/threonine-protein kinase
VHAPDDETRLADEATVPAGSGGGSGEIPPKGGSHGSGSYGGGSRGGGEIPPEGGSHGGASHGGSAIPPKGGSHGGGGGSHDSSGWTSSTTDIDHGRFAPGALLDQRYRIIGRLGKGGMGEVYRADDLRLGQPVALKFLPEAVDRDPARLTQLHTEVRMARQVSHPNVCRVYDVGEVEGHTFLSMEYVDGEDLASLLRRIGRFPEDRALELARQICAGLAAAHDRNVVHRDLKPANIMLDGNGRIRITDFGLAGAAGEALRAGTPAYMAPEQLAGSEVTPRSDIYALGLVLYELFTGRRALQGSNLAELIARREQAGITPPSQAVTTLDPAIDRAIMRCLQPDPANRPASALAVAASLPGGDPLAAALAAGETPSPEMVAAAGTTSALRPLQAFAGLLTAFVLLAMAAFLADRLQITSLVPMPKPPVILAERAKEILGAIGYKAGIDSAHGFMPANFLGYAARHQDAAVRARLVTGEPASLHFWYRGSPTLMVPQDGRDLVTQDDPAFEISDMTLVVLDPEGRLVRMAAIPPQYDPPSPHSGSGVAGPAPQAANWKPLFDAAGLDLAQFTAAAPEWTPTMYADTRVAWTGPMPGLPGTTLRLEAGSYRGRPVYFHQVAPWTTTSRMATTVAERRRVTFGSAVVQIVVLSLFIAAGVIARHNWRKGRGDRRGAAQLTAFILLAAVGVWVLDNKHVADPSIEMQRFFLGQPLWAAGLLWLLYLAVEPYVRRFWPSTLVSWSRLMARQWRDPLVGRDILFGVALGLALHILGVGSTWLGGRLGYQWTPNVPDLMELLGTTAVIARVLNQVFNAVLNAIFAVFAMVLLKLVVKREWLASAVAIGLAMLLAVRGSGDGSRLVNLTAALLMVSIIVLTIQRLGLVAITSLFFVYFVMTSALITLDTSRWFFPSTVVLLAIPAALALYGFYASRGGEPIFGSKLLD